MSPVVRRLSHASFAALTSVGIASLLPQTAFSQVTLYQQSSTFPALAAVWTSNFDTSISGFNTMDDFILPSSAAITEVRWQAMYWDFQTPANNPVAAPSTVQYQVAFLDSTGSQPNNFIYNQVVSTTRTFVGTASFGSDTVSIYDFRATLPTSFFAQAGVQYWVSPFAIQNSFNPLLGWVSSTNTGGTSYQDQYSNNVFQQRVQRQGDRAFSLIGGPAPEPSALGLALLTGSLAIFVRRRNAS